MSLALDLAALRDRFVDEWDADAVLTVFTNATHEDPKENEPFVRFSITPGNQSHAFGTGIYEQLGRVWLQIFVPPQQGTALGYDLVDQFTAIFRNWKSEDGCVRTFDVDTQPIPNGPNGYYQINVSIRWESLRRL